MKNLASNKIIYSIVSLFIVLSFCIVGISAIGFTKTVKANSQMPSASLYLPNTEMEYSALNNPIDVYSDDYVTAVAQDDQTLLIYKNGKFEKINTQFTAIKQIKKLDEQTLLVSDGGPIYKIDLTTLEKTPLLDSDNQAVTGNYFDLNENYLVTAYSDNAFVYTLENGQCVRTYGFDDSNRIKADANRPISINENNTFFYVNNDGELRMKDINNLSATPSIILGNCSPSKMIANANYVYYIQGKAIYRVAPTNSSFSEVLTTDTTQTYDLGKLTAPTSLAFKNGNLFITDTDIDAVQEFKVVNNTLEFTGFAIASGKTAYNRVNLSATDIIRTDDKVAVLENNRLSVITISSDKYAKENYNNYTAEQLGGSIPNAFALGLDYALLSFNQGTTSSALKMLNLNDDTITQLDLPHTIVEDVCYQSGYFYAIITDNDKNNIYRVIESENQLELVIENADIDATRITVDVLGNIFLSDSSGKIVKFTKSQNYQPTTIATKSGLYKMQTDLAGKLFVLALDGLSRWDGVQFEPIELSHPEQSDTIKSFSLSFDNDDVYLLYNNKECIARANDLGNIALSQITAPAEYITTASTTSIDKLKMATIIDGANVYSVEKTSNGFNFNGLIHKTEEYVVICDIVVDQTLTLTALAEKNGIVLVDKTQISVYEPTLSNAPSKAFVTTDVNAYYFPIINRNTDYALFDSQVIRLEKNTRITPLYIVTVKTEHNGVVSDANFYIATFNYGQVERTGYIPVAFTVETLQEDFEWHQLSIETIKATTLYSDSDFTQEIKQLPNGKIRVIEKSKNYAKVAIETENGYEVGYIRLSAIINTPQIAIRNILLILVVLASVCGTTTYFILRKKKY